MGSGLRSLGGHRVLEPAGVLPQAAVRVDPDPEIGPDEVRIAVERLNLDAASFRQLTEACAGDGDAVRDAVVVGVFAGLLVGKVAGIFGGAQLAVRLRLGRLPERVTWADVLPVAILGGIGYTVSLLLSRLAFTDVAAQERAAAGVLAASVIASILAVVLLRRRSRAA